MVLCSEDHADYVFRDQKGKSLLRVDLPYVLTIRTRLKGCLVKSPGTPSRMSSAGRSGGTATYEQADTSASGIHGDLCIYAGCVCLAVSKSHTSGGGPSIYHSPGDRFPSLVSYGR